MDGRFLEIKRHLMMYPIHNNGAEAFFYAQIGQRTIHVSLH